MKALYKYPHAAFPYERLVKANAAARGQADEVELLDTGVMDGGHFDVRIEYAKAGPNDLLARVTVRNHGPAASLVVMPQLWFKNNWSWGDMTEGTSRKPQLWQDGDDAVTADHETLGRFRWHAEGAGELIFADNETNHARFGEGERRAGVFYKDAFHEYVVGGDAGAVCPDRKGTKAAAVYRLELAENGSAVLRLRLHGEDETPAEVFGEAFDATMTTRRDEYRAHLKSVIGTQDPEHFRVAEQAVAGLLWSKQFYHYAVREWLDGDPQQPPPPARARACRPQPRLEVEPVQPRRAEHARHVGIPVVRVVGHGPST